ncbi:MAG TPA: DUF1028 domain-containing protein [Actinomycetota bacterium]
MTFSIVGIDLANGDLGVAVASKFPAVGAAVPFARAGVGAVATQAAANTGFGPTGLSLMAGGLDAAAALDAVLGADDDRDDRQVGMVDARGGVASFTGSNCFDWAEGRTGDGFAVQGNILAGAEVLDAMTAAFGSTAGDLVDRLLAALLAGDRAGGDRRGRQSAAILVVREAAGYGGFNDRYVDLRVDDHPDAPAELARLFRVWDDTMLVRRDTASPVTPTVAEELQARLAALGYYTGRPTGAYDAPTRAALSDWAGWENLELRLREDDELSTHLLEALRAATPDA